MRTDRAKLRQRVAVPVQVGVEDGDCARVGSVHVAMRYACLAIESYLHVELLSRRGRYMHGQDGARNGAAVVASAGRISNAERRRRDGNGESD